jgi:predicted HNH restriction endonuclease
LSCKIRMAKVLAVHHLDHDRNNNNVSNLVWLCFNCHFLVHNDKDFEKKFTKVPNYRKI